MASTLQETGFTAEDVHEHREAFHNFSKLILFSILHICLVLTCLALAFVGNIPVLALLIGLAGTFALGVAFMFSN